MKSRGLVHFFITIFVLAGALASFAAEDWPGSFDITAGVCSRADARFQLAGEGYGTISPGLTLRAGAWLASGDGTTHGYLANAYIGMDRPKFYLAGGQKFVVFGPAGLLVSSGTRGGEVVIKGQPLTLHLLAGRSAFTPPFGIAGRTTPNTDPIFGTERIHEQLVAARAEYDLIKGDNHSYLGLNTLWTTSKAGGSLDLETSLFSPGRTIYVEVSDFDGISAQLAGMRFKNVNRFFHTPRETTLELFWKNVPGNYIPAEVGASQYYAEHTGLSVALNHKLNSLSSVVLTGDSQGVQVNFVRQFPLVR
jgi:hypothetical protein